MKKILLSTIILTAFALSITLFELSCKKTANAQSPSYVLPVATTSKLGCIMADGTTISVDATGKISAVNTGSLAKQQNKIIFTKNIPLVGTPGEYFGQIWAANYDGTNQQQINITLPAGLFVSYQPFIKLSPDQKTIFFYVDDAKQDKNGPGFYSANIDGTNAKLIIANDGTGGTIEVAY
jgi:hypothetical protein